MATLSKKCGSTTADVISSVSSKYPTKESTFHNQGAVCELTFDGTKNSLVVSLANCSAQRALRNYGMPHTITHIIKHLPELYECEHLHKIDQIIVLHDNVLVIRVINTSIAAENTILQIELRAVLDALQNQDAHTTVQLARERITLQTQDAFHHWLAVMRTQMASRQQAVSSQPMHDTTVAAMVAAAVGCLAGMITYFALK